MKLYLRVIFLFLFVWGSALSLFGSERQGTIVLVLTNHAKYADTDRLTGLFLSEAAHPYRIFQEAGFSVTLASPEGGKVPIDPRSFDLDDPANSAFFTRFGVKGEKQSFIKDTLSLSNIKSEECLGIFFAGGQGTMWDFPNSESLQKLTVRLYEEGTPIGAVCHGPAALVNLTLSNGETLVKGKQVAVFTNAEEKAVGADKDMPFLLQSRLIEQGAKIVRAEPFQENAVRDGLLVTGQNPKSAKKTAELFVEAIVETSSKKIAN